MTGWKRKMTFGSWSSSLSSHSMLVAALFTSILLMTQMDLLMHEGMHVKKMMIKRQARTTKRIIWWSSWRILCVSCPRCFVDCLLLFYWIVVLLPPAFIIIIIHSSIVTSFVLIGWYVTVLYYGLWQTLNILTTSSGRFIGVSMSNLFYLDDDNNAQHLGGRRK